MSNSTLVDIKNEDGTGNLDKLRQDLTEAITATDNDRKETEAAEKQLHSEDVIPEKYRGKSIEDVIKMHQNAERKIGQTGNELGQYKQLTDQLLDLKRREDLAKGGAEPEEEDDLPKITPSDILDDPDAAVARAVEARLNRAERKKERQSAEEQAVRLQESFAARHPDAADIAEDPEFQQFVQKSPSRQMLAAAALNAGNLFAANVLLDEWKSGRSSEETHEGQSEPAIEKARKATTISSGSSHASDAPAGKVYSRLDLIKLKLHDPETYQSEQFQNEIMRAYAEGRVK